MKTDSNKKRALIAMSGGVDSSVAVYLMQKNGYDCTGVTMRLFAGETDTSDAMDDAKAVAHRMGIPHILASREQLFTQAVVEPFIRCYEEGGTPNPCIECNRFLKFGSLFAMAEEQGFDTLVTGHYARVVFDSEKRRYCLKKAFDLKKDQSYVLYMLTQKQLARVVFPLGELTKETVRSIAEEQGFVSARKKDSQDICFVPDGDYVGFIRRYTGKNYPSGEFVAKDGRVLGQHKGIIGYTVGQRRGLGLSLPAPLYVCEKDPVENRVILGENRDLFATTLWAEQCNFMAFDVPPASFRCSARVRYAGKETPATVYPLEGGRMKVIFDEPQRAITKGQSVVLYDGDEVLGGGTITQGL